jgi:hypothetical protein
MALRDMGKYEKFFVARRWCETHNVRNPNKNIFTVKGFLELLFRLVLVVVSTIIIVGVAGWILSAFK